MTTDEIMAEMLSIIEKARYEYANDVTDHTENEYIREALLNANYLKRNIGKWIFRGDGPYGRTRCYCSSCGQHSGIGGIRTNQLKPYCPNCGATMIGEGEE